MSAVDCTTWPSTATTSLWYSSGTAVPDQCARPIDAMTRLSISTKPGNGRPIHSLDVMVVRVATAIAASPISRAVTRVAAGLDRAEGGHCEVLPARQAVSTVQPAVIGDVDQEIGPLAHGARDQLGK